MKTVQDMANEFNVLVEQGLGDRVVGRTDTLLDNDEFVHIEEVAQRTAISHLRKVNGFGVDTCLEIIVIS